MALVLAGAGVVVQGPEPWVLEMCVGPHGKPSTCHKFHPLPCYCLPRHEGGHSQAVLPAQSFSTLCSSSFCLHVNVIC